MKMIPCCFHPTRVMVVDDCVDFLKCISIGLSTRFSSYQYISDPVSALNQLNGIESEKPLDRFMQKVDEAGFEHRTLDINICDLHQEIYDPNRFNRISTVLVDYHMPKMNGLEFCDQIKDPNIQKILLTGTVDERQAINAFNDGLIDKFIRKQSDNVMDQINDAVQKAQLNYFHKTSSIINKVVSLSPDETALNDRRFIEFFRKTIKEREIVEWYLTESMGSFLMLDAAGKNSGLFTYVKEQLDDVLDCVQAESAPSELKQKMMQYNNMLCFHSQNSHTYPDGAEWKPYVYPAQKIEGQQAYYCACAPNMFDIENSKITSFGAYLRNNLKL